MNKKFTNYKWLLKHIKYASKAERNKMWNIKTIKEINKSKSWLFEDRTKLTDSFWLQKNEKTQTTRT